MGKRVLAREPLGRKLTIRLSEEDFDQLQELRLAMHCRSEAGALRALIQLSHARLTRAARRAAREARKAEGHPGQLPMFGGAK